MRRETSARRSRAAGWARFCGALAVPVLALGAVGSRIGLVPPEALIPVLALGFAFAITASGLAVLALVDIWRSGALGTGAAIAGLVYAAPVLVLLGFVVGASVYYPPLNDISTDPNDPPSLAADTSPAQPFSPDLVALQTEAHPDIIKRRYTRPIADVYSAARLLVEERGWAVTEDIPPASLPPPQEAEPAVASAEAEVDDAALEAKAVMTQSRAEAVSAQAEPASAPVPEPTGPESAVLRAVARTPTFGFVDRVALRFRGAPDGTEVDMRSASGMGSHDLGQNARRIRRFLADLDLALQPDPNAPVPSPPGGSAPAVAAPATAAAPGPAAAPVGQ